MVRLVFFFFFQAEGVIRDLVRSRGLGDVYKRQGSQSILRLINKNKGKALPKAAGNVILCALVFGVGENNLRTVILD